MEKEIYETQSIYEASWLLTSGFKIVGKQNSGKKTFIKFKRTDGILEAVQCFYNGEGKASSKALFDNFRTIKDYIFQR